MSLTILRHQTGNPEPHPQGDRRRRNIGRDLAEDRSQVNTPSIQEWGQALDCQLEQGYIAGTVLRPSAEGSQG